MINPPSFHSAFPDAGGGIMGNSHFREGLKEEEAEFSSWL